MEKILIVPPWRYFKSVAPNYSVYHVRGLGENVPNDKTKL